MTTFHGLICSHRIFEFKGWTFEESCCGPWPLRKDGEPRKRAGRVFWRVCEVLMIDLVAAVFRCLDMLLKAAEKATQEQLQKLAEMLGMK